MDMDRQVHLFAAFLSTVLTPSPLQRSGLHVPHPRTQCSRLPPVPSAMACPQVTHLCGEGLLLAPWPRAHRGCAGPVAQPDLHWGL